MGKEERTDNGRGERKRGTKQEYGRDRKSYNSAQAKRSEDIGSGGQGKRGVRLQRGGKGAREVAVMTGWGKGGLEA